MNSILLDAINKADTIAISGHIRPDGDCVGSTTALYYYIKENFQDKKVCFILDKFPDSVARCIERPVSEELDEADLFVSMDSSSKDRLGDAVQLFEKSKVKFVIDHHKTNSNFGDINVVEPSASSCAEVLYELLEADKISRRVATSIYIGIIHDTGVFKYSATSSRTMNIAGELMDKGLDTAYLIDESFYSKSYKQNMLLARGLTKAVLLKDIPVIYTVISADDLCEFEASSMDTDGIVEQLRLTKGVETAVFIRQDGEALYKVSLRCKTGVVDVSEISIKHGGGGHKMAAGFSVEGSCDYVINTVISELRELFAEKKHNK
ncbi:MAG: bifunctional oligoribonuclease/PAP phosphatase NrnA [Clostridiales bacterium]|nr:bifunctional oligoribonuclease/PAP phosphatase NrnA [Clostridiales bacterium]